MQGLTTRVRGWRRPALPGDEAAQRRTDLRWGIAGIAAVVVLAATFAVVYTVQRGVHTYTAELTDASALRVGDEVRVAGLTVGKVTELSLRPDRVRLRFTIDNDVFLGAQTTLGVRMLTIVGGHYLAVTPAGDQPLGATVIPADRVVLPYSLPQVFQDAVRPIREIDGDVLRRNLAALQSSITNSPDGFRRMLDAVGSIVGILDTQNSDVSRTLALAGQYSTALADNKAVVGRLLHSIGLLEVLVENNKLTVGEQLRNLADVLSDVTPLATAWNTTLQPLAQQLSSSLPALDQLGTELGALLDAVRGFGQRLQPLVTADGITIDSSGQILEPDAVCVPVAGRSC